MQHNHAQDEFWHSDGWWMRLSEGRISADEARAWQAHLRRCRLCGEEWRAWQEMERLLTAAPLPRPSSTFVEATVQRWSAHRRRRRWWMAGAILFIVPLSAMAYTVLMGGTFLQAVALVQKLWAFLGLLVPMLVRALVTLSMAFGTALPWIAATFALLLIFVALLDGTLLAGSAVFMQRRSRR